MTVHLYSPPMRVGGTPTWDSDYESEEFHLYPPCEGEKELYPFYLWGEGKATCLYGSFPWKGFWE